MRIRVSPILSAGELIGLSLKGEGEGKLEGFFLEPSPTFPLKRKLERFLEDYSHGRWEPSPELLDHALKVNSTKHPWTEEIYKALLEVPPGEVITYRDLGKMVRVHPRKAALSMKLNAFPLIIPCHRVVSVKGLGGYSPGKELKKALLSFERDNLGRRDQEELNLTYRKES